MSSDFLSKFGNLRENNIESSGFKGYDPNVNKLSSPLNTTPISARATSSISTASFNHKIVSNKNFEPYVIVSAPHDSSDVFLHDIDSKRILLTYEGELHLETSNGNILKKSYDLINTIHGQQKGYVFYKQTKEHMNLIDSLFGNEWRNELKNPLPVVEERNPDLLWEGKIGTNSYNYLNIVIKH